MNQRSLINQFDQIVSLTGNALTSSETLKTSKDNLFDFLDQNYKFYLQANLEERIEIRNIVRKYEESNDNPYMIDFFLLGYIQRAIENIELTGEKTWLIRGLIVSAIEDGIRDHRDTIDLLAHLFVASDEKGLNPETEFKKIAIITNDKPSIRGAEPMSQIMLEIPSIAYKINDDRKKFL